MDQVYYWVGLVTCWAMVGAAAAIVGIFVHAYARGFYLAVSYTLWAAKNSNKRDSITKMMIVKNIFMEWHEMATAGKASITATAPNGSTWSN